MLHSFCGLLASAVLTCISDFKLCFSFHCYLNALNACCWLLYAYDLTAECSTSSRSILLKESTAQRVTDGMHIMWKHREADNARIEPSLRGKPDVDVSEAPLLPCSA